MTVNSDRPTLRDIAELAGVSIATVSKALNGRDHVKRETRERVERIAARAGFFAESATRGVAAGRSGIVGLLTNDLEGRFSLPILIGAEDAFGAGSTSVLLCDARGDGIREQHHLRSLLSRRVDGIIVVGNTTDERRSLGQSLPVPIVYAYSPSDDAADISVVSDNVDAGVIAAGHLIDCGRSRIAYISGDRSFAAARDRVIGAEARLREAQLELLGGTALYGSWSETWGRGATKVVLERFPEVDAILAGSDQIARGVLDALRDAGRRIPEDVAVIGHDNQEQLGQQARPSLSTIDMDLRIVGRRAAELLFAAILDDSHRGTHRLPCRLITRGSTAVET